MTFWALSMLLTNTEAMNRSAFGSNLPAATEETEMPALLIDDESNNGSATMIDEGVQYKLFVQYTIWNHQDTPSKVLDSFRKDVMDKSLVLTKEILIGPAFDACANLRSAAFAGEIWNYITAQKGYQSKPSQFLYSKMMRTLRSNQRRGGRKAGRKQYLSDARLRKAVEITDEWIIEYKTDPMPLKAHLTHHHLDDPVILNQMLRIIIDSMGGVQSDSAYIMLQSHAIHYFQKMIELNIIPDDNSYSLIKNRKLGISPTDCIGFIEKSRTLVIVHNLIDNLVKPFFQIHRFDANHDFRIRNHLNKLRSG